MSSMKKFIVKKKSVEKTETTQSASTTESSERTSVKQVSGTSGTVVTSQISSGGEISTETRYVFEYLAHNVGYKYFLLLISVFSNI